MVALTLFLGTFSLVFLLGLQSLNVNNGHKILAAITSFFIGCVSIILYKLAPNATWYETMAFLCGGPIGIIQSMNFHPKLVAMLKRKDKPADTHGFAYVPAETPNKICPIHGDTGETNYCQKCGS